MALVLMWMVRTCIGSTYRSLTDAGKQVAMPGPPSRPLTGWKSVSEETYRSIASSIALVTSGEPTSQKAWCLY